MSGAAAAKKREVGTIFYTEMESPVGKLRLVGNEKGLRQLSFANGRHTRGVAREWVRDDEPFQEVLRQLRAYFRGELKKFDLRLEMQGTEFQKSVWEELRKIPYGETRSYGQVAEIIGNPKAMRAVGAANGQNPIAIVVPCHRVIGSSGSLTGFGGGMDCKKRLLELEKGQITLL